LNITLQVPEQSSKNQIRELDHQNAKNQSQILQRQLLEQQIAENAARKEVASMRSTCNFEKVMPSPGHACTLSETGASG